MENTRKRGMVISYVVFILEGLLFLLCRFFKTSPSTGYTVLSLVLWVASLVYLSLCVSVKSMPPLSFEIGFCFWGVAIGVSLLLFWSAPYMMILIFLVQWAIVVNFLNKKVIHILAIFQCIAVIVVSYIPQLDYVSKSFSRYAIPVFALAVGAADWVACHTVNNFSMMYEEIKEHDRSLDDLLKIVETKHNEAKRATRVKSEFLSNMSHEIRTPINSITGFDEMILRESNEDIIREYATNIKNSGNMLLALINDILDISKIEDGKMKLTIVEFSLPELVNDVINMIKPKMDDKGLEFNVVMDRTLPSRYYGDDMRIKQILINILNNAAKYTHEGSVDFQILDNHIEGQQSIRFSVEDTGIGIKEEDLARIKEKYVRFDEEKNRFVEGSGLGMTIVNGFLEMMGSHLVVESIYGEGSNFSFDLVFKVADPTPIEEAGEVKREKEEYASSFEAPDAHVLVVDDNPLNIKVFVGLLKETKVQIDTATGGEEAVFMGEFTKYDVIFMDHMMPGMDGIDTMKAMTDESSLNKDTPFVVLTANAVAGAREMYLEKGFVDFITKPVQPDALEHMVAKYVKSNGH